MGHNVAERRAILVPPIGAPENTRNEDLLQITQYETEAACTVRYISSRKSRMGPAGNPL
jgi:hypothetical protein